MSHGKRDFTEVIKVMDLEVRTILDSPDGPNLVTSDLKAREISPAGAREMQPEEEVRELPSGRRIHCTVEV